MGKASTAKSSNGLTNNHTISAGSNAAAIAHAQYYPHLLLSDAKIGAKLQVCALCVCVREREERERERERESE